MRIAILINDQSEASATRDSLNSAGHQCDMLRHADAFAGELRLVETDLLLLDCSVAPDNLMQLVQAGRDAEVPVLLIASPADDGEVAACIEAGASDYLLRPVRTKDLLARVRVLQRRFHPLQPAGERLEVGPYRFDMQNWHVSQDGKIVQLTRKEFELALLFFRHLDRPLSRAYIRESVWPRETEVPSRTLDTHVSRVRSKLALRPENGFRLAPVYSFGYQLAQLG